MLNFQLDFALTSIRRLLAVFICSSRRMNEESETSNEKFLLIFPDLLPLQNLRAEVDGNAVNITITPPEIRTQNVADAVEVMICDVLAMICFEPERIPKDQVFVVQ